MGRPLGPAGADGVEPARVPVGDSGVQDVRGVGRAGQRALGDRIVEQLAGVVAGQLGAAQHAGKGGGAVLGGDPRSLVGRQQAVDGELVEPVGGAGGRSELGCVGEPLSRRLGRSGGLRGVGRDCRRRPCSDRLTVGQDAGEDGDRVAVQLVVFVAAGGVVDAGQGDDVREVGVPAARERDVERGQRGALGDHGVAGVHRDALGGVHSGGVAEGEVLGDVARGEHHAVSEHVAVGAAAQERGDVEAAVGAQRVDAVGLAVDRAAAVAFVASEVPLVPACLDQISNSGGESFGDPHADLVDVAEADEFGTQLRGQARGLLVGVHQQQGVLAGQGVSQPRGRGRLFGRGDGTSVEEPAVLVIVPQHRFVAFTEAQ